MINIIISASLETVRIKKIFLTKIKIPVCIVSKNIDSQLKFVIIIFNQLGVD